MAKTNNTPAIRFKGFTDPWEQRELISLLAFLKDGTHSTQRDSETGPYLLSAKNVKDGQVVISDDDRKISEAAYKEIHKTFALKSGDVLLTIVGSIGEAAILNDPSNLTFQRSVAFLRAGKEILPSFLYWLTQCKPFQKKLDAEKSMSAQAGVYLGSLGSLSVVLSLKKGEQAKIATYLDGLDSLITLHQRKLDKLTNVKKSMLEKLFPESGRSKPRIRFKGFADPWEQRKLASLCDKFTDGNWIEAKDQSNSGVRLIQTGNVGVSEFLDKPNNKKWITEETYERLHCKEVLVGDILISRLPEPAGRACVMPFLGTKMITAVDCTIVRVSLHVSNAFLVQYLSSQAYFDAVNSCLAGGTRQRISRSSLANFDVFMPIKRDEQELIGILFFKLDSLITLHQRKLEKLKNLKKSLLEKMFVA